MATIDLVIDGRERDLGGGFHVRRVLPSPRRRHVGPFVFLDEMGPASFGPGDAFDVRPHPHIGLATVTFLFEGEIFHRDSLGTALAIRPGAVNWMVAGRGIVHSERVPPELRGVARRMHGIQAWIAVPAEHEDDAPSFVHHPADSLPRFAHEGAELTLIAGDAYGRTSPVATLSPMFYADARLPAGTTLSMPNEHEERGVYVVRGAIEADGERFEPGRMLVFAAGEDARIAAVEDAHVMLLGGRSVGERSIEWNFVASTPERIRAAAKRWKERGFELVPGDDQEFIPLPE